MNKQIFSLTGGRKNASFFGQTFFQRRKKCHPRGVVIAMRIAETLLFLARLFFKEEKNAPKLLFLVRLFFKEEKNAISEGVVHRGS